MAIEDIVINFHGGTAASISGKTINNFEGISAGEFSSDLLGYDTGTGTGVSISAEKALTAFANGRFVGADLLTQELNQQSSYVNDGTAPSDNIYTVTLPAGTTLLDVELCLCVGSSNQNDIDGAANGQTFTAFDSTNNTTGATVQLTNVVPNGSNQVIINIDNQHPTNDFTAHNAIRLHNIIHTDPGSSILGLQTESEDFQAAFISGVASSIDITVSQNEAGDTVVSSIQAVDQISSIQLESEDSQASSMGVFAPANIAAFSLEEEDAQAASLVENLGFVNDDFTGTGALGPQWSTLDESAGGVINVGRVSDYFEGTVDDNSSNRTRWFNAEEGRFDFQNVKVPATGTDTYIARNVGVGTVADPRSDLPYLTNQFSFCGIMVKQGDDYMFMVLGHRGSSDQYTAENKSTISGVSDVNDEGPDVVGVGKTHGDIRVEIDSSGNVYFSHAPLATDTWTLTNGGTGLVPSAFSLGTGGDDFEIGIIGYASDVIGVPFKFSVDSMELLANVGVTGFQTESDDQQISLVGNVASSSANQQETGELQFASIDNVVSIQAARVESQDSQSSIVSTQVTSLVNASQSEEEEFQISFVSNVVQISANSTEASDAQSATVSNIAQLSCSQAETQDAQSSLIVEDITASVTANQAESQDSQSATLSNVIQLFAGHTEENDTQTATIGDTGPTFLTGYVTINAAMTAYGSTN